MRIRIIKFFPILFPFSVHTPLALNASQLKALDSTVSVSRLCCVPHKFRSSCLTG